MQYDPASVNPAHEPHDLSTLQGWLVLSCVVGFLFTFTNFVYVSALPSLLSALMAPVLLFSIKQLPRFVVFLLLFFIYVIISAVMYYPRSLTTFGFYRYDGNFIVSFMPLFVLPFLKLNMRLGRIVLIFLLLTVSAHFLFTGLKVATGGSIRGHVLFTAANAAGGFLAFSLIMAWVRLVYVRSWLSIVLFVCCLFLLLMTASRGSILGLMSAFFAFYLGRAGWRWVTPFGFILASVITIIVVSFTYSFWLSAAQNQDFSRLSEAVDDNSSGTKSANVAIRAFKDWPRGVFYFLQSPVFGTGIGSVNDEFYSGFIGIEGVLAMPNYDKVSFDSGHSHHSYIHLLAEMGIVGTALFLMFVYTMYRFIAAQTALPWMRDGVLLMILTVAYASFTEHRFTTPAMAIPMVLAAGLYLARLNALGALRLGTKPGST
jgi:O-antigen ligase